MTIAIDGYEAAAGNRVGLGRYAYEILRSIREAENRRHRQGSGEDFRIYVPRDCRKDLPEPSHWWQYREIPLSRFWTLVGLPWGLHTDRPMAEVVFSPTHYSPRFTGIPRCISVMDLSYLYFPGMFRRQDLYKLRNRTRQSVMSAAHVFTISRSSRDAIIREYGLAGERITVTYPGVSLGGMNMADSDVIKSYGLGRHYILSVGTLQPRKNYVRLIGAFATFLRTHRLRYGNITLAIVGKKGWLYDEITSAPGKSGISGRVKFLDFVPDAHLPVLYSQALAFVLPSLYEGFGLPVLEAMHFGCPVVVSDTSSLPEIAGKAGIYVDPLSTDSIAAGILRAVRERNLKQGRDRIALGRTLAARFTWEQAAEKTLEVIKRVGKKYENTD
ncbi:hypothetical protein A2Z33_05625 [Candidatus Gottesmanbacteria bacterium RBG_16_52_11]|uniref:Glycosyl transferase family 1 domain-containing protein n=1 Tax=Candidatus Gottesmanbacteria bacterium RBG_16_52_11 TaxID=1798374 RepID=A0A1F5YNB7_9BACT|nr:MAG: hypothetical protein A2Z33_05625 [Candidatus Gottesmanbacteria bacterium RBG_16_52_11]